MSCRQLKLNYPIRKLIIGCSDAQIDLATINIIQLMVHKAHIVVYDSKCWQFPIRALSN
jgi:hypothetical protein